MNCDTMGSWLIILKGCLDSCLGEKLAEAGPRSPGGLRSFSNGPKQKAFVRLANNTKQGSPQNQDLKNMSS